MYTAPTAACGSCGTRGAASPAVARTVYAGGTTTSAIYGPSLMVWGDPIRCVPCVSVNTVVVPAITHHDGMNEWSGRVTM